MAAVTAAGASAHAHAAGGGAQPRASGAERAALAAHLAHAFRLVDGSAEHAWARAFLLDTTPQNTLSVVTNRAAAPFSVTSRSVDTAFETAPASGREAFDSKFAFDALLVPSFATGGLSVGVVVNRIVAVAAGGLPASGADGKARCRFAAKVARGVRPPGAPSAPPAGGDAAYKYSVGRYVRDERKGTLLIVKHTGNTPGSSTPGGTQVMFLEHLSSTRRYRLYFHCDTPTWNAGRFVDSVLACVANTEARHCPVCNESPGANCSCEVVLNPPKYAFDFGGASKAMQSQSGDYLGQAGITIALREKLPRDASPELRAAAMDRPKRYVSAPLISSLQTQCFSRNRCDQTHDALAEVLRNFAVQVSLDDAPPARAIMPPLAAQLHHPDQLFVANALAGGGGVVPSDVDAAAAVDAAEDDALDAAGMAAAMAQPGLHDDCDVLSKADLPPTPFGPPPGDHGHGAFPGLLGEEDVKALGLSHPPDFVDACLMLDDFDRGPLLSNALAGQVDSSDEPCPSIGEIDDIPPDNALLDPPESAPPPPPPPPLHPTAGEAVAGPSSVMQNPPKRRARARVVSEEELAARELRRKKKNRESAARANAKKKAINDELKANIRNAKQRAAILQARQTELVKENLALRRQAGLVHTKQKTT